MQSMISFEFYNDVLLEHIYKAHYDSKFLTETPQEIVTASELKVPSFTSGEIGVIKVCPEKK